METQILTNLKKSIKHWYLSLIVGIIFIAVGIWVFLTPVSSYITLAILFAVMFLVTGIIEISFAIGNRKELSNWGWTLAVGIIDLLVGILLVAQPGISILVLPIYVGFAVMFRSISAISWSVELKNLGVLSWGNLLAVGILGLLFSFILLWNPMFAGMTIVVCTALAFIFIGCFYIYLSVRLRKLSKIV